MTESNHKGFPRLVKIRRVDCKRKDKVRNNPHFGSNYIYTKMKGTFQKYCDDRCRVSERRRNSSFNSVSESESSIVVRNLRSRIREGALAKGSSRDAASVTECD